MKIFKFTAVPKMKKKIMSLTELENPAKISTKERGRLLLPKSCKKLNN